MEDAETGETKAVTINAETLAQYKDQQQAFCDNLQRFCTDQGVDYAQLKSDYLRRILHFTGNCTG